MAFSPFQLPDAPRQPKRPPRSPQDGPRAPQDGPTTAQEGPKTAPEAPKTAQEASTTASIHGARGRGGWRRAQRAGVPALRQAHATDETSEALQDQLSCRWRGGGDLMWEFPGGSRGGLGRGRKRCEGGVGHKGPRSPPDFAPRFEDLTGAKCVRGRTKSNLVGPIWIFC